MSIPEDKEYTTDKPRIRTLDSLRGLAAITVVIAHIFGNFNYNRLIDKSPFYFFKAAHEAVIFFFILSGYVLVYQYESKARFRYLAFLLLRVCRIYLPYIVSVFLAYFIYRIIDYNLIDNTFFGSQWTLPVKTGDMLDHIILIGNFNTGLLNPVIWSLVHEMRMAIFFPLLLLIIRLKPSLSIITGLSLFIISAFFIVGNIDPSLGYLNGYFYTSYYFFLFLLGGLIVRNQKTLLMAYERLGQKKKAFLLVTSLLVYTYAHTAPLVLNRLPFQKLKPFGFALADLLTTAAACCFIIIAVQKSKNRTYLDRKPPLFIGKISYSLYLTHIPVIAFLYKELRDKMSIYVILLAGVVISFITAVLYNFLVEKNANRLGKQLLLTFSRKNTQNHATSD